MIANIFTSANFWYITEAVVVVAGSVVGVWRVVHNALARSVADNIREMQAELKPNHGSSMRDAIDRIEKNLHDLSLELARHLGAHEGL
jgi:hypothetical protein